ncbi:phosphoglucomutase/phosphomannomutase family protein [Halomarina ordinaria]|uniref:Phosphoglucomutase/phosphomannomutase family protein n=1 Tax=Halomarina ordinaria TaxID=3033939 RepID=A0ABD5UAF3_9EURY|nr:phosphoglucomutase/phosphomannomutase family protein [Halomarina sp. PSRA2]
MEHISFGTDGWRATLDTFTEPRVRMVGQAVADHLRAAGDPGAVAVGYDARDTSRGFADALAEVLADNGFEVLVSERDCPTPVLAWTVRDRGLAGGLMVTASHNPPEYNGVKFLPPGGAPALPEVTDDLEDRLAEPTALPEADRGTVREDTFTAAYCQHAVDFAADPDLDGLRIAYDAMHGSGRGVTDDLLAAAGASVERLRTDRDPTFGGESPEPTAERLGDLVARVTEGDADLGFANDGDADRLGVITPERGSLDPNLLYAVLYDYLLDSGTGGAVRTVSTTSVIDRIAEAHGERAVEVPVGFKWVAEGMREHDALVGGEESGGFGITAHLRNKDGVLLALVLAAAHAERPLDERADDIEAEFGEIHQGRVSVTCPDDRKAAVLDSLDGDLPETIAGVAVADVGTADGFKVFLEDGTWLLVRPSGTEPKLRVYAEADSAERVEELLAAGSDLVEPRV